MSKVKTAMAGLVLGASTLASGQALAETSGSLNITSEYMFRGIVSEGGAAVQGSLDWASPGGLYAGAWASNSAPAGGTELDLYVGWAGEMGNGVGVDLGVVYYGFTEQDEIGADADYFEVYGGLSLGGLSGSIYYSDDFFASDEDGIYYTLAYSASMSDTVDMTFQVGFSQGDGVELVIGDEYTDWSVTLSKDLGDGAGVSFGYVQTDLEVGGVDDEAKFVVSASKEFTL